MKSLKVSVAVLILGLTTPALAQLACPPTQTTPNFNSGGSVFGRIAAQWNVYFGAKVDSDYSHALHTIFTTLGMILAA